MHQMGRRNGFARAHSHSLTLSLRNTHLLVALSTPTSVLSQVHNVIGEQWRRRREGEGTTCFSRTRIPVHAPARQPISITPRNPAFALQLATTTTHPPSCPPLFATSDDAQSENCSNPPRATRHPSASGLLSPERATFGRVRQTCLSSPIASPDELPRPSRAPLQKTHASSTPDNSQRPSSGPLPRYHNTRDPCSDEYPPPPPS